ncbi:hypothetical protein TNCV_296691 [Trichonephila clavipes]|nr:hypothetical protein TNCV_296691 [Trichonephila clavipes]
MLIQPDSTQPGHVRSTVALLGNSNTVRITEQHIRMEMITQQLYVPNCIGGGWYTHQRSQCHEKHPRLLLSRKALVQFQPDMQDPWLHGPGTIFSASRWRYVVEIKTHHSMLLISSLLHSSVCALLPRQDVQPDGEL